MILSYHPCFSADENRICAGRKPDATDRTLIQKADAVILPQGCSESLYRMASQGCNRVFPNYNARFDFSGKTGQIRLFQQNSVPHPLSAAFTDTNSYLSRLDPTELPTGFDFPVVFKFDWGGEGETVKLIQNQTDLASQLKKARHYERSDQKGFVLQTVIPTGGRVLRVVRMNDLTRTYWRIAPTPDQFLVNLSTGATIDYDSDPHLQAKAVDLINLVCTKTGINLAAFDVIFSQNGSHDQPLLLEINYFFGREGLGGSNAYLDQLTLQIKSWINEQPLVLVAASQQQVPHRSGALGYFIDCRALRRNGAM